MLLMRGHGWHNTFEGKCYPPTSTCMRAPRCAWLASVAIGTQTSKRFSVASLESPLLTFLMIQQGCALGKVFDQNWGNSQRYQIMSKLYLSHSLEYEPFILAEKARVKNNFEALFRKGLGPSGYSNWFFFKGKGGWNNNFMDIVSVSCSNNPFYYSQLVFKSMTVVVSG